MGQIEKKISFYTYLFARIGFFVMAMAIAYTFFFSGTMLELIKFPLVGGEVKFRQEEKLPEGTIKIAVNQVKYIFNDQFYLRVRPIESQTPQDDWYHVTLVENLSPSQANQKALYNEDRGMATGETVTINRNNVWYVARLMQIVKSGESVFLYFHVFTDSSTTLKR